MLAHSMVIEWKPKIWLEILKSMSFILGNIDFSPIGHILIPGLYKTYCQHSDCWIKGKKKKGISCLIVEF